MVVVEFVVQLVLVVNGGGGSVVVVKGGGSGGWEVRCGKVVKAENSDGWAVRPEIQVQGSQGRFDNTGRVSANHQKAVPAAARRYP